jgi:hypothetical protein
MRILVFFAATLLSPLTASAQVWTTLPFGASVTRVRDFLTRQPPVCTVLPSGENQDCVGLSLQQLQTPGDFSVEPGLDLTLGAVEAPFHFKTLLHFFDTDQKLVRVDLMLDTDRQVAEGTDAAHLAALTGESVLNELLARYGAPLLMSPACEPSETRRLLNTQTDVLDCSALWKPNSSGQTLNLLWQYQARKKTYSLIVRYARTSNSF